MAGSVNVHARAAAAARDLKNIRSPQFLSGGSLLDRALDQHLLDLGDRLGRIEALGAGLGAIHDSVAPVEAERVLKVVEPLALGLVAAVAQPAIGLQQDGGAEIAFAAPPVTGA